jgi:hypothetical protein
MKRPAEVLLKDLIYAILVWVVTHCAYIMPITMAGAWPGMLVPGQNLVSASGHVMLICLAWLAFRNRVVTLITSIAMVVVGLLVYQLLAGWPTIGMRGFGVSWLIILCQNILAPILAFTLLALEPRVSKTLFKRGGQHAS